MIFVIDGGMIAFKAAIAVGDKGHLVNTIITNMIKKIINELALRKIKMTSLFMAMDCPNGTNFRKIIDPTYKANRTNNELPLYLKKCKEHLYNNYACLFHVGWEADDVMCAYVQSHNKHNRDKTIIIHEDKDCRMIAGLHCELQRIDDGDKYFIYNVQHPGCLLDIRKEYLFGTGIMFFWYQMIVGDSADNVIGPGHPNPYLLLMGKCHEDWYSVIREHYRVSGMDHKFFTNMDMLWLKTNLYEKYFSSEDQRSQFDATGP